METDSPKRTLLSNSCSVRIHLQSVCNDVGHCHSSLREKWLLSRVQKLEHKFSPHMNRKGNDSLRMYLNFVERVRYVKRTRRGQEDALEEFFPLQEIL